MKLLKPTHPAINCNRGRGSPRHSFHSTTTMSTLKLGKSGESLVASLMLRDGLDVYVPLADDHGVDLVVEKPGGKLAKVQVKTRSGGWADFGIDKYQGQDNFWYVFYESCLCINTIWLLNSAEFDREANQPDSRGYRNLNFCKQQNGKPVVKEEMDKYIVYSPKSTPAHRSPTHRSFKQILECPPDKSTRGNGLRK